MIETIFLGTVTTAQGLIRHANAATIVLQSEQTNTGKSIVHNVGHVTSTLFGSTIYDTRHVLNFPLLNTNICINWIHFLSSSKQGFRICSEICFTPLAWQLNTRNPWYIGFLCKLIGSNCWKVEFKVSSITYALCTFVRMRFCIGVIWILDDFSVTYFIDNKNV